MQREMLPRTSDFRYTCALQTATRHLQGQTWTLIPKAFRMPGQKCKVSGVFEDYDDDQIGSRCML